jgi:hypothetical protein
MLDMVKASTCADATKIAVRTTDNFITGLRFCVKRENEEKVSRFCHVEEKCGTNFCASDDVITRSFCIVFLVNHHE